MRSAILTLVATFVACGAAVGAEPNEHLKDFGPFIGNWRYEGPFLHDVSDEGEKGTKCVVDFSWRWILGKHAVMMDWSVNFEEGATLSGKKLSGWNAAEEKIVGGGMSSMGGMGISSSVIDGNTITTTVENVDDSGTKSSTQFFIKKKEKDTLTWQPLGRTVGDVEGESPIYTFKRIKRKDAKKAADTGQVPQELKGFGPFVGQWRYDGKLLEDVPGFHEKGAPLVVRLSIRRILDKKVVMEDWLMQFADGNELSAKVLVGWNAADSKLAVGLMNSVGAIALGNVKLDPEAKTSTLSTTGVNVEGEETSYQAMLEKTGKDTLTWQRLGASAGLVEGEGPVYEFKRVKRSGKKATK